MKLVSRVLVILSPEIFHPFSTLKYPDDQSVELETSFTTRGVQETVTDQQRVSGDMMIADAYAALKLLSTHPRIDPNKIGIMGFSKGGTVSLNTAFEYFRQAYIQDHLRFAVHVPFYPVESGTPLNNSILQLAWHMPITIGTDPINMKILFCKFQYLSVCLSYIEVWVIGGRMTLSRPVYFVRCDFRSILQSLFLLF